jgi:hypothetical protein
MSRRCFSVRAAAPSQTCFLAEQCWPPPVSAAASCRRRSSAGSLWQPGQVHGAATFPERERC